MTNLTVSTNNFAGGWDNSNDLYPEFLQSIKDTFESNIGKGVPLFKTEVGGLFDIFLNNLPEETRQHYNCNTCRGFVRRYGSLVTLTAEGKVESALWKEAPGMFDKAVKAMRDAVLKGRVMDVFLSDVSVLGRPITEEWEHMSITLPMSMTYNNYMSVSEAMAKKREDFKSLMNGIQEFSLDVVKEAVNLLNSGELARSEKHTAAAEWLRLIHERRSNTKNKKELDNIVWYAVGTAPEGWCHVKGGMLGNLLEDVKGGASLETIKRNRANRMAGDAYQRPQAAPPEQNIKEAERIFAAKGLGPSLERRYARYDEIQKIWEPAVAEPIKTEEPGLFSHLKPKKDELNTPKYTPEIKMTWRKFAEEVLPKAKGIQYYVPFGNRNYTAIVTAVHPDAPPIIQWDNEEERNPFSWYLYKDGTPYTNWNLLATGYHKVNAITFQPSMWNNPETSQHQGKGVIFILDGAKDLSYERVGAVLFPEILKSELHPVRATIEAYSERATMQGFEESSACGLLLHGGAEWNEKFLVTTEDGMTIYKLDRWD